MNERGKGFNEHRNLLRLRGRGRLLALLEAPILVTSLDIAPDGRFIPETQDWETFWAPVRQLAKRQIDGALNALHAAWQDYIRSCFDRSLQREYCFRYFSLLDLVLATEQGSCAWRHALRAVVGFECFGLGHQLSARKRWRRARRRFATPAISWPSLNGQTCPMIPVSCR